MSVERASGRVPAVLRQARRPQESVVQWVQLLAPVLLVVFVVYAFRADPAPGLTGRHLVVTIAVVAFPVGVLGRNLLATRNVRLHRGFVALVVVSAVVLVAVQPDGPGAVAALVGALFVTTVLPRQAVTPFLVVAFLALETVTALTGQGFGALAILAAFAAFYAMLVLAVRLGKANRQAERLLVELRAGQQAQAHAAGLAERQRLAREMHDVLAHSLSGLVVQLEGARLLAAGAPDDPRLPAALDRAHHLARSGLDEARSAIGMLRDDDLPGPERLPELASRFELDRNVPCRLTVSGVARPLASEARVAMYRVAQEALTNVGRHAHADRVELHLEYGATATRLVVEDFATTDPVAVPPEPAARAGGYGLTGMRERAELLGGTLTTGPTCHGFRVELEVPR